MKPNYIKNWYLTRTVTGSVQLHGVIYNDSKKRFADGTLIGTSRVLWVDFQSGVLVTKNTTYNLDMGVANYGS